PGLERSAPLEAFVGEEVIGVARGRRDFVTQVLEIVPRDFLDDPAQQGVAIAVVAALAFGGAGPWIELERHAVGPAQVIVTGRGARRYLKILVELGLVGQLAHTADMISKVTNGDLVDARIGCGPGDRSEPVS